jgi:predicted GNAT family N-acyltransferase
MIIVWSPFAELSAAELYRILRLRQEVFVVEQRCAYLDADGYDEASLHAMGRDQDGQVTAVARLLPPGCKFEPALDRTYRGRAECAAVRPWTHDPCGRDRRGRATLSRLFDPH